MTVLRVVILVYLVALSALSSAQDQEQRLYAQLFQSYNSHVRPVKDYRTTVNVSLELDLHGINHLNTHEQILHINAIPYVYWKDEFLVWTSEDYDGLSTITVPPSDVWLPDFVIRNRADDMYNELYSELYRVIMSSDGFMFWSFGGLIQTTCELDLTYFPFDKQKCSLHFENWAYTAETVELQVGDTPYHVRHFTPNGEWEIDKLETKKYYLCMLERENVTNKFPSVRFDLLLSRKYKYYMINLVAPCLMMMLFTLAMFWLPPDSGEKVSLGITIMLAFSVLQLVIADKIPVNSDYFPVIGIYVTLVMGFSCVSTIITICVLRLHHHEGSTPVPHVIRYIFLGTLAKLLLVKKWKTSSWKSNREDIAINKITHETPKEEVKQQNAKMDPILQMESMRESLEYLVAYLKDKQQANKCNSEWKLLAVVVDRLLFCIMLILCTIVSAVTLSFKDNDY